MNDVTKADVVALIEAKAEHAPTQAGKVLGHLVTFSPGRSEPTPVNWRHLPPA